MQLLRYFEAKQQNRNTVDLLRELDDKRLLSSLPGAIGEHYRKFDDPAYHDVTYCNSYSRDKHLIQLLQCCNDIQVQLAKNGDVRPVGARHCGNKALCACCGTREARRVASQLRYMFLVNSPKEYEYYMLTLTLPNRHDGFREEFNIYNKCLYSVLNYCGYQMGKNEYAVGAFASRELTYSKEKGFHPHIHIIIAYKKSAVGSVEYTRKGVIKSFELLSKRPKVISALSIRDYFQSLISKRFPEYYAKNITAFEKGINIDFRHIDDIENSCDEICKYFIDYNAFSDADSLYIYLRDIFQLRKYTKLGCFGWSDELENQWLFWCKIGKPVEQIFRFIQLEDYIFFGRRKVIDSNGCVIDYPVFYHKSELINDGKTVNLEYRPGVKMYVAEIYNEESRKLGHYHISKIGAYQLLNTTFSRTVQHKFDKYNEEQLFVPFDINKFFDNISKGGEKIGYKG